MLSSAFMDTNYFRMLSDANMALSGRVSLQDDSRPRFQTDSTLGSPASSSRTSLDLDSQTPLRSSGNSSLQDHPMSSHLSHDALNQGYYGRFFVEQRKLGRGFRGSVFLCQHVLDGIHLGEYAIKKVAVGDNHEWLVQMLREVHLLERLHHPNIVSYKHAWLENHQLHKFGPEVTCLFILMECANGGNLEEYVERPPEANFTAEPESFAATGTAEVPGGEAEPAKPLSAKERLQSKRQRLQGSLSSSAGKNGESEQASIQSRRYLSIPEIWSLFFDICEGLAHLHRLGIIHRDLKPPNLLLSYSNNRLKGTKGERPRILITDFGECEILDQAAKRDRTGATGTLEFLAPELLAVDSEGRYTNEFSFKGDMWSLGMVLYYLCYSRLPYTQIEDVDILRNEIRQFKSISIPEDGPGERVIPEELKILIRVLLSPEKSKRPSCDDILTTLNNQRDRMMRGDTDPAATPVRASTDLGYVNSESTASPKEIDEPQEGDDIKEGVAYTSSKRQVAPARSGGSRQPHRQNYRPVRQNSAKVPIRRHSRTTLIAESPSKAVTSHGSTSFGTMGTRNTISPSINLHRRIKPLGLGLRHMLRRKMNHPAALMGNSFGIQRYPSRSGDSGDYKPSLDLVAPVASYPLALENSVKMPSSEPTAKRTSPTQVDTVIAQHQLFQERKQAAHGKESTLGSTMELAPEVEPGSSVPDAMNERKSSDSSKRDIATGDQISSSPGRKKSRHYGQPSSAALLRESFDSEGSSSESSSIDDHHPIRNNIRNNKNDLSNSGTQAGAKGSTVIAQSGPVLGKTYWTKLASNHAREKSSSNIATGTDVSSGVFAADESNEDSDNQKANHAEAGIGSALGRRRAHTRSRTSLEKYRPDHSHILYPVLILTVVWDRYLISLISEKIKASSIRSTTKHRRGSGGTGSALGVSEGSKAIASQSSSSSVPDLEGVQDRHSQRKEANRQSFTSNYVDNTGADADIETEPYSGGEEGGSSLMIERPGRDIDQQAKHSIPIWQALVSGIILQLLWIGAIWFISRDGLCTK
ncbi:hypothetical protein BGX27_010519 [Mortierella sp. AM989]|nr:hypothetical protein BGX27_010519 [Mortierella sp. AM989]